MKNIIYILFTFISYLALADTRGDKINFRDTTAKVEDLKVISTDAFATDAYIKTKVRFENKNDFFIILDPSKSFYYVNGTKIFTKEKELLLPPGTKKTKVFDVKYDKLKDQAISLVLDGYSKTGNEKMVTFPDVEVKGRNKASANNVDIAIDDIDYDKAQKMHIRVKVTNVGNDILLVNSGVIELSVDGNTMNNVRKRSKTILLKKGESDMIAMIYESPESKSTKKIILNDAFVSASLLPMSASELVMASDPSLLKEFKPFIQGIEKKQEPIVTKDHSIALDNRSQKNVSKKTTDKKEESTKAPKEKVEVVKSEPKRSESSIASEGEMQELHAANVDLGNSGGKYYALLIGVSDYNDPGIADLDNLPVNDAIALGKVLKENYTFNEENINILKNPTRREIVIALDDISKKATAEDNVLIFYAGHGHYEDDNDIGYWLPKDAEVSNSANWLYNDQLVASLRKIKSLHTLLISDACFSGSIFKNRSISLVGATDVIKKKYQLPSRKAITSGTLKTVPNKSVFIKYLTDRLTKNQDKYFAAGSLYRAIEEPVGNNSTSLPQYGVINNVGDEGGDFIFIRK